MPDASTHRAAHDAKHIAPDAHGRNFYTIDRQFQDLLSLYMEPGLLKQMTPHFERLGELAGNRLDDLAMMADKHPPVLQPRDRGLRYLHPAAGQPARPAEGRRRPGGFTLHRLRHSPLT